MYDEKFKPNPDPELRAFEEALLRSLDQPSAASLQQCTRQR